MIIIITGASHTGKTKLAQALLEKYKYPYLSIDHLKMGLIRSGNTRLTPDDDGELTEYLWPIVSEMIKTAVENRQNMIVEGCYIPFDWKASFTEEYLAEIKYLCLCMTGEYIETHFDDIKMHSSDAEKRLDDSYCSVERLKRDNLYCLRGCEAAGNPAVLICDDYMKELLRQTEMQLGLK